MTCGLFVEGEELAILGGWEAHLDFEWILKCGLAALEIASLWTRLSGCTYQVK